MVLEENTYRSFKVYVSQVGSASKYYQWERLFTTDQSAKA